MSPYTVLPLSAITVSGCVTYPGGHLRVWLHLYTERKKNATGGVMFLPYLAVSVLQVTELGLVCATQRRYYYFIIHTRTRPHFPHCLILVASMVPGNKGQTTHTQEWGAISVVSHIWCCWFGCPGETQHISEQQYFTYLTTGIGAEAKSGSCMFINITIPDSLYGANLWTLLIYSFPVCASNVRHTALSVLWIIHTCGCFGESAIVSCTCVASSLPTETISWLGPLKYTHIAPLFQHYTLCT